MNNTRFATLIHILTILAKNKDHWVSSDWMAESININRVIVRKELSVLQKMGWVVSKKGKDGGSKLHVSSCEISMADIYVTVKNSNVLGKKNNCCKSNCPIGKDINNALEHLFNETDELLINALEHKKLKSFVSEFK